MKTLLWVMLFFTARGTLAQFSAAFLQNEKYWNDGKAEFDIYDAKLMREGALRDCEVTHILVREPFDPQQLVKPDDWEKPGMISVLKMNQILHVPTGLYVCQQMHSAFWRIENGALLKWSLTSNDSCGNTFKLAHLAASARSQDIPNLAAATGVEVAIPKNGWKYNYSTYWDTMAEGAEGFDLPRAACFYDELPMRVRTIVFSTVSTAKPNRPETGVSAGGAESRPAVSETGVPVAPDGKESEQGLAANRDRPRTSSTTASAGSGQFEIQLAPSVINSKKDKVVFTPANVSWQKTEREILVTVAHSGGTDRFTLAPQFPYLLREWKMADGGELRLKQSLKVDYWRYNKPGDKERALADPALQNR